MNLLETWFPNLANSGYVITSPAAPDYNCIAWAAHDNGRWWWPDPYRQYFWPGSARREDSIGAFVQAYGELGFQACAHGLLEQRYEKVAIYADSQGVPTHAARQLPSGKWTSKLGTNVDIEHGDVHGVEGSAYGHVVMYMRRKLKT